MRFGVLGPVTAWTDSGEPVTVPGLKVRALLADLLVHEGRPVPADRLIDDLWGDDLPGNPAGTLSAKVSQLRRAFEDAEPGSRALVVSGPAGYSLKVDSGSYDALTFAAHLEHGRLVEALALWRGPAYADFSDEAFVETAVARLSEQRLTATEDYFESRQDHSALIGEVADLLVEYPLRERLRAVHMKALYRAGRQSEALESYEQLRSLLADELGLDPTPELVALQQSILTQELQQVRRRSNLPAQLTELVGRGEALVEIQSRLYADRLVTLTGPGGVGKTRLALAAADGLAGRFPDGVFLVELAAVAPDALNVAGSLADLVQAALDLRDSVGAGAGSGVLAAALEPLKLLLVLDNCEHVVEAAAALADELLAAAPGLRVLATSREPLGLTGEAVWSVPPLEVPEVAAALPDLQASSAVQLFVARAAAADRGFSLDEGSAAAVSVLCRRLDGIPLALELAATRVRALGVQGLVARLDDRFRLLATGHRGAAPRQQTLTAMIDWSWDLLAPSEQAVLRRLAVQVDGCTAEAAEQVCCEDGVDVLDVLMRLVDRSLVVSVHGVDGPRYRLLESVAEYCVGKLRAVGELETVKQRHRLYYVELAEAARDHLTGPEQGSWLQRLDDEAGNLRSAFDGAVANGELLLAERLADALAWYWFLRGRFTEARRSLEALPSSAKATAWLAGFLYAQGDVSAAAVRDRVGVVDARAEWWIAFNASDSGDLAPCLAQLERALSEFEATGDQWGIAAALAGRAKHAHVRADFKALESDAVESARLFRVLGDRWGQLQAIGWLGALAEMTGDLDEATRLHTEALQMAEALDLWPEVAGELGWLGWTALRQGAYAEAKAFGERALRLATEQGHRSAQALAEIVLGFAARRSGELESAELQLQAMVDAARKQDEPVLYLSIVLQELGYTLELQGELERARASHAEAYRISRDHESRRGMCWALEGLAACVYDKAVAARLLGVAAAVRAAEGYGVAAAEQGDIERATRAARDVLGGDGFAAQYEVGRRLELEEAFSEVVGDFAGPGSP
ncbi:BTAD domain-containing putative transcriptional regulator [Kribbella sp. CA-293567]|uniref:BTAD domain-containing putative transcriptional regulator n=1 Tax=Kribbella sp. CA-293567 TaxID=3002436 RepID=UPI0022DE6751|nr:BTAD domain-containing putative transcriptional regulator [Kribbella sp. CA-293567]WBQ07835.1 BTAD domain-containing putative transcriptional regulator [Kribbella sp. CA-293567]